MRHVSLRCLVFAAVFSASYSFAEVSLEPRPVTLLRGGHNLSTGLPAGWTHVALAAKPKLVRGDRAAVPEMVLRYVETFGSVILAKVEQVNVGQAKEFRLRKIAVGHTIDTPSGVQIVDSSSPEVDFIGGRVLASGEKELAKLRQVASYETALVFDTPAVMVRDEKHVVLTIRNFVWTSATRGGLATAMWTIADTPAGPRVADEYFVWAPAGFQDERQLSVDPSQFTFGLPGPRAFAMVRLPAGDKVGFTAELARVAATPKFTPQSLQQLAAGLATAIAEKPAAATIGR